MMTRLSMYACMNLRGEDQRRRDAKRSLSRYILERKIKPLYVNGIQLFLSLTHPLTHPLSHPIP